MFLTKQAILMRRSTVLSLPFSQYSLVAVFHYYRAQVTLNDFICISIQIYNVIQFLDLLLHFHFQCQNFDNFMNSTNGILNLRLNTIKLFRYFLQFFVGMLEERRTSTHWALNNKYQTWPIVSANDKHYSLFHKKVLQHHALGV